ncbi:MAG: hypothetical protein GTO14_21025 [Anaerolineales bacterium]|nr:hypothetical protein [Anaerolineales bacterium]
MITLVLSVLFCVFALASKETGFLTPLFILSYILLFPEREVQTWKVKNARLSTLFILATVLFLVWRTNVIGGLGIKSLDGSDQLFQGAKAIVIDFFIALVDPNATIFAQLKRIMSPYPTNLQIGVSLGLVVLFLAVLLRYRGQIIRLILERKNAFSRLFVGLVLALFILSFLAILVYPVLAPLLRQVIEDAYHGRGLKIVIAAMEGREKTPVESYLIRARDTVLRLSYPILIYSVFFLAASGVFVSNTDEIRRREDKILLLMLFWLLFTLALFILTSTASRRSMYFTVSAFSTILAIVAVRSSRSLVRGVRGVNARMPNQEIAMRQLVSALTFVLMSIVIGSLVLRGPLFGSFPKWERNGKLSEIFFNALSKEMHALPEGAQLTVVGLPSLSESSLMDYSVKSWLDLRYPGNGMTVVFGDRVAQVECPECLKVRIESGDVNHFDVIVDFSSEKVD